jgi:hypothetical protein
VRIFKPTECSNNHGAQRLNMRCPSCKQLGTFESHGVNDVYIGGNTYLGHRFCPNLSCAIHLFVAHLGGKILISYPPERLDFDATDVPRPVTTALDEAITCHANECFTAAAIMVRKTLEELCRDRGAHGSNLKDRIRDLGTKVILPIELMDGLDDLRLLGNDAAHFESHAYDNVGKEEIETGIEFTKEVLKAVYQYKALLQRLQKLKKAPPSSAP